MLTASLARFIRRFFSDSEGGVLILFGLAAIMLIVMVGMGIDLGMRQIGHARLQSATDAASIAAASLSATDEQVDDQKRADAAMRYFNLNYPNTPAFPRPGDASVVQANGRITVSATASTPSYFGGASLGGWSTNGRLTAPASTTVSITSDELGKYDMILALDYTKSMDGARLDALKEASNTLIDSMLQGTGHTRNRVAIIKWAGNTFHVEPLTNNIDVLKAQIADSDTRDGTNSTDGLKKALDQLNTISEARKEEAVRVVVLLTDGGNNAEGGDHANIFDQNMKSLDVCRQIKQTGAILHTVLLGEDWGPGWGPGNCNREETIKSFLSTCASNGKLGWARESTISHADVPGNPCQPYQYYSNIYGGVCRHTSDDHSWNVHGVPGGKVGDWCCIHGWNDPVTGNYECDRWFGQADFTQNEGKYYHIAPNPDDLAAIFKLITSVGRMRIVPSN